MGVMNSLEKMGVAVVLGLLLSQGTLRAAEIKNLRCGECHTSRGGADSVDQRPRQGLSDEETF